MGFIRGMLIVLASTVFFFASLSSAIFFTIGSSLDYATVENKTIDLVGEISSQINLTEELNSELATIRNSCKTNSDYILDYEEYTFQISCDDINKSVSTILNNTIKNFVSDLYYKEYNCNFWDCFRENSPTFLISAKSQAYWYKLFYFALTALLASAAALFFLIEKKRHLPFLAGGLVVLSSLIVLGINKLLTALSEGIISEIIGIFFSKAGSVFIRMIVIAAIILFAGLVIEFYRVGFKVYNLFSKLEEKRENASKDKSQKSQDSKKK